MKNSIYYRQANLLLRTIPAIRRHEEFALKGGTAINFFVREMPRLSVDIDLTYLPSASRQDTLSSIDSSISNIKNELLKKIPNIKVRDRVHRNTKLLYGLLINDAAVQIKIEVNTIIRSSVFQPQVLSLCKKAEDVFELSVEAQCLSLEDLFGGKICAALDRQHPRDLFDIKLLLENEGLTDDIRKAFIVYLISHDRPIVELLNPNAKDISTIFEQEFSGMTDENIELKELIETFSILSRSIKTWLEDEEKEFLLSFKRKEPNWNLLGLDGIEKLPSVQWKLKNLERMSTEKHNEAYHKLEEFLKR